MDDTRKPDQSAAASGQAAKGIVKAVAGEKKAQGKFAEASRTLRAALDALTEAKSGSSGEKNARKAARAAIDVLVTAKGRLRKTLKKRKKAFAKQVRTKARTGGTATAKPTSGPAPGFGSKSRQASAPPPTPKPDEKKAEARRAAKAAAKTSTDSVAGGTYPDEAAHVHFLATALRSLPPSLLTALPDDLSATAPLRYAATASRSPPTRRGTWRSNPPFAVSVSGLIGIGALSGVGRSGTSPAHHRHRKPSARHERTCVKSWLRLRDGSISPLAKIVFGDRALPEQ